MNRTLLLAFIVSISFSDISARDSRWQITGSRGISWEVKGGDAHKDHIEMSGKFISAVIHYEVNPDQSFYISRDIVWPMLRTIPNNTHGSLIRTFNLQVTDLISVNKKPVKQERVSEITLNGKIVVKSILESTLMLVRTLFPSTDLPVYCEKYEMFNNGSKSIAIAIPKVEILYRTLPGEGVDGSYSLSVQSQNHGVYVLQPNESLAFSLFFLGMKRGQDFGNTNVEEELASREALLAGWKDNLILETPDEVLNRTFAFAKIRAAESIYQTKGGPMHGPGGLSYYAAIWANDQAEYINPFFPFLGYRYGIESAVNAYRHFARFMNNAYKSIPSSIIAEGIDTWNGVGDRGDAAMIAYGASRFALSQGDRKTAEELWPLIGWCLEYNRRKLNPQGVVMSDTDELEGRFPAGKANLCTSSLYYDALVSASYLGKALGKDKTQLSTYKTQAAILKANIGKYFGANVMGFNTYQYYEGNDKLRAWICIPLTVGIFERGQATVNALFSPQLWTPDGLATESGGKTFWDRSTLYALRGVFAFGDTKRGLEYLRYYSTRRLLGDHVPYPVEAWPEGNQRHLSAESGLYCRVYLEGLFGIRPTGLTSFTVTPRLPDGWDYMRLRNVHGYQRTFDLEIRRESNKVRVVVKSNNTLVVNKLIDSGDTCEVHFKSN
ncbi:MAG: hypothetical protein AB2L24_12755 [Mangrovibacterium sp.]